MRRLRQLVRVTCMVAVLFVGTPAVLVYLSQRLLPQATPTRTQLPALIDQPLTPSLIAALPLAGGWLIWLYAAGCVLVHAYTQVPTRRTRPRWHLPAPMQTLTAAVIGAAAVSTTGTTTAAAASTPPAGDSTPLSPSSALDALASRTPVASAGSTTAIPEQPVLAPSGSTPAAGIPTLAGSGAISPSPRVPRFSLVASGEPVTVTAGERQYTVIVKRGDTLWHLADAWLGDPTRWPEIYRLNANRYDDSGRMRGGEHIEARWTLALPDDAIPPARTVNPPATRTKGNPPLPSTTGKAQPPTSFPAGVTDAPTPAASTTAAPAGSPGATPAPSRPPDDGVAAPPVPATPPGATKAAPVSTSPSARVVQPTPDRRANPPGVLLPGGSWVDLGLAAAIAAAAALVWLHRRHRYLPRPPTATPRLDDPDLTPTPAVVRQVAAGLRRGTAIDTGSPADIADDLSEEAHVPGHSGEQYAVTVAPPVVPALNNPTIEAWPPAGLGLTGPGAHAAARGFLTAALSAGGLENPDARTWVIAPATTIAALLGDAVPLPVTPRLTVTAGLDEALDLLEAQTLYRTRLLYRQGADDVAALRHADPLAEPLPPIMLIAAACTRPERIRITAVLAQGQRLDIHGILLGPWPDGNTVVVAADGTTTAAEGDAARHGSHPADVGRLAVLDPAETADLLSTLAESHTGQPQAAAPAENTPPAPTPNEIARSGRGKPPTADNLAQHTDTANSAGTAAAATRPEATATVELEPGTPQNAPVPPSAPTATEPGGDAGTPVDEQPRGNGPDRRDAGTTAEQPTPPRGRVNVTVLGGAGIVEADPQRKPRKKSLELLVHLAVHDGSASAEAILDDLLPDASAKAAPHRLHTYVSDLRAVLRHNGGPGTYITNPNKHYALNRETIDIDLWRMRAALRDADIAPTGQERTTALRRAVDTYTGPLADECDYEWIEPYREAVRRQALDAASALADALNDQPEEQLAVLLPAIGHHPYAEELYRTAMRAQAKLGDPDAVRALRRTLTRRLADIDAEPQDESTTLADQLVAQLQTPGRRARLRPTPGPGDGAAS